MKYVTAKVLKPQLTDGDEIALLDVREHGQYGEGHPFFSVNLPYSRFEALAEALLPCRAVRCVVFDDGDGVAEKAARVLEELGYADVRMLQGGAPAWAAAGYTLFKGVNVPSKTFGEMVEHEMGTRAIAAEELKAMLDAGKPVTLLDGRSPKEFQKMSLPGARSCPNAELAYRLPQMVADESTPIVVNCAGRTRSIIGAQTLRELGVANPIFALRNGTQGWRLAGFELDRGRAPGRLPALAPDQLAETALKAERLIAELALPTVDLKTLEAWLADPTRSTYLLDVRTAEEFAEAHLPGARSAPGGQLVQAIDEKVAVRNARIVLTDDTQLRAATTAMWLTGMGHQAWILKADASKGSDRGPETTPAGAEDTLNSSEIPACLAAGAVLLDASRGLDYQDAHVEGAHWATRARLEDLGLPADARIIVTGRDRVLIAGVAKDLCSLGHGRVDTVAGAPESWRAAGLNVVATPELPSEADCIDFLFFVHDRHDGNLEAARRYLAWELGLLEQIDDQERSVLRPELLKRKERV
ncbi:MAG: sulfurtransferase [Kiloniellaceae bacterium]|nr:sulfurtransferase [Kiloniellaceae bacterium]